MAKQKFMNIIVKNERLLPAFIFLLFLAVSVPGVKWGLPALWNPDELAWRVGPHEFAASGATLREAISPRGLKG